ncbi:MAG TPA: MFS transporter [Sphingomonas sp.]|nr:MFS transporter [Sphingomonas sp.]
MATPTRWQATIASALCMAVGMSAVFMGSFPVFLEPVSTELGWGRATFPQIITVVSVSGALLMPFAGRLIDRIGVRWPVAAGLAFVSLGMFLLSFLHNAGFSFWIGALCLGAGAAFSGPPAFVGLVSSWHDRNRALALGIVLSVAPACAQAIVAPVTQRLIAEFGWRASYRMLAAFIIVVGIAASIAFLHPRPSERSDFGPVTEEGLTGHEALRTSSFWLLAISSCLASGTLLGLTVHVVAWLTGRGVAADTATYVLSVLFLAGIAGAFVAGYVADRTRSIHILQIFYALPIIGLAAMAVTSALPALLIGAVLFGIGMSATTGLAPYLVTRYFGLKGSAEIFGILLAMTLVSIGVAPVLIGIGYDATGAYAMPLTLAAAAVAIATLCVGLADRASRRRHQASPAVCPVLAKEPNI